MQKPHITTQFVATQTDNDLEIWVDWIPAVDGVPNAPLRARIEGDVLVLEPVDDGENLRVTRHVTGLEKEVLEDIRAARGFVWYITGPSGVLGEHRLQLN